MKRLMYALLFAGLFTQQAHPYRIKVDGILPTVDVYVFKNANGWEEYLKNQKIPNQVLSIVEKIQGYTQQGGVLLKGATQGESEAIAKNIDKVINAAKKLKEFAEKRGLLDKLIRSVSVDAFYLAYKKGDLIEWNANDIKKELGNVSHVYFVVIDPRYNRIIGQYQVDINKLGTLKSAKTKYAEIYSTLE